jgi:hypothetical protein
MAPPADAWPLLAPRPLLVGRAAGQEAVETTEAPPAVGVAVEAVVDAVDAVGFLAFSASAP